MSIGHRGTPAICLTFLAVKVFLCRSARPSPRYYLSASRVYAQPPRYFIASFNVPDMADTSTRSLCQNAVAILPEAGMEYRSSPDGDPPSETLGRHQVKASDGFCLYI